MAQHAKLAPSASSRWVACPGSVALIESLPPEQQDKPNRDSMWGTACHEMLARALDERRSAQSFVGDVIVVDEPDIPLTEKSFRITAEDAANVEVALGYVRQRAQEYGAQTLVYVEEKVRCGQNFHLRQLNPATYEMEPTPAPLDDCDGTADVVLIGGGYLEVIDYKNGQRFVPHEGNTQLLLYALGAMKLVDRNQGVQRVRLTIVQPRAPEVAPGAESRSVRPWELTVEELMEHALSLGEAAHATRSSNAPRKPGDHCRTTFCPAQAICPELSREAAAALLGSESETIKNSSENVSGSIPNDDPTPNPKNAAIRMPVEAQKEPDLVDALRMTPDQMNTAQLARILSAREMIRAWLNDVESHAHRLLMSGERVPGFKLVMGRRSRSWSLPAEELMQKLSRMNRIGEDGKAKGKLRKDTYTVTEVISPRQAELKVKPMVTPHTWKNIEELIKVEEGKPTIAPETDSRAEVKIQSGEEVFGLDKSEAARPSFMD